MSDKFTVFECLRYLAETDDECGRLRGVVRGLEQKLKICKAMQFLKAEGAAGIREQIAIASDEYRLLAQEYQDAYTELQTIETKRETRIIHIEVWRSQNANRRQGNI